MRQLMGIVILLSTGWVQAQESAVDGLRRCSAFNTGAARLRCYDQLATAHGGSQPEGQSETPGTAPAAPAWRVTREDNPLGFDSAVWMAVLPANPGESTLRRQASLLVTCKDETLNAYITWQERLGRRGRVTLSFDQEDPKAQQWELSADSTVTFVPQAVKPSFLKALLDSQRLAASVSAQGKDLRTAVFQLQGTAESLDPIRKDCPTVGTGSRETYW